MNGGFGMVQLYLRSTSTLAGKYGTGVMKNY